MSVLEAPNTGLEAEGVQFLFAGTPVRHVGGHHGFEVLTMIEDPQMHQFVQDDILGQVRRNPGQAGAERDMGAAGAAAPFAAHIAEGDAPGLHAQAARPDQHHLLNLGAGGLFGGNRRDFITQFDQPLLDELLDFGIGRLEVTRDVNFDATGHNPHHQAGAVLAADGDGGR